MRTLAPRTPLQRRRCAGAAPTAAFQAVGLPGSQGWLARMQSQGPDGRAHVMNTLQQSAGNRAVARSLFGSLVAEGAESLIDRAMCFTLKGSVGGKDAENDPQDVQRVRARLKTLGYPTTEDPATLVAAIERYQRDVVGLKRPDGRIDPAGRTLTALNAAKAAAPVGAPAVPNAAKPEIPAVPTEAEEPAAATASAGTTAAPAAAGPPPDLAALAARSPGLKAALDGLERLKGIASTAQDAAQQLDKDAKKAKQDQVTHGQEWGAQRDRLVAEIKVVRKAIDDLKAGSGLSAAELASVLAYLYRELARIAPYYYQMVNANILEKGGKAGGRTCNVTSLAMTLEALGKSAKDYQGPETALMPQIAKVLDTRVGTAIDKVEGEEELAALRLPDFLQLLVIAKSFNKLELDAGLAASDPAAFVKAVEKARNDAAGKITSSGLFDSFIGGFGVKVDNEYPWGKQKLPGTDVSWADAIERVGEINRGSLPDAYKAALAKKVQAESDRQFEEASAAAGKPLDKKKFKAKNLKDVKLTDEEKSATYASTIDFYNTQRPGQVAEREKRLAEIDESLKTVSGKDKKALTKERGSVAEQIAAGKRDKRLADIGLHNAATDPQKLAKIMPTETYAAVVSAALKQHLDAGHQVVGHMHNHFFRVEAVTPEGVVVDDPGSWTKRTYTMKWEEALKLGSFSRFTYVEPK